MSIMIQSVNRHNQLPVPAQPPASVTSHTNSSSQCTATPLPSRTLRFCDVCLGAPASLYCAADAAYLCTTCDRAVHTANSLAQRHERVCLSSNGAPMKIERKNGSGSAGGGVAERPVGVTTAPQALDAAASGAVLSASSGSSEGGESRLQGIRTSTPKSVSTSQEDGGRIERSAKFVSAAQLDGSVVFQRVPKTVGVDDDGAAARAAAASTPAPQTVPVGTYFQSEYQQGHAALDSLPCWDPSDFGCIDTGVLDMLHIDIDVDNLGGCDGADCPDTYASCWDDGDATDVDGMYASVPDLTVRGISKGGSGPVCDIFGDSEGSSTFQSSSVTCLGAGVVTLKTEDEGKETSGNKGSHSLKRTAADRLSAWCSAGWDRDGRVGGAAKKVKGKGGGDVSSVGTPVDLFPKGGDEKMTSCGPSLRLDYEDVLLAWSERGISAWVMEDHPEAEEEIEGSDLSDSFLQADNGVVPDISPSPSPPVPEAGLPPCDDPGGGDRKERVLRYREKRRNRLFSKKVRYEVRKINAERRPRIKGRFVKRVGM